MQSDLFVRILNISIISCYIIVVVMVLRALLLRGERKYVYLLWFVVFVNLCIPFRISGPFSLIPGWIADFDLTKWLEEDTEENAVYLPQEIIIEKVESSNVHNYTANLENGGVQGVDSNNESVYIQNDAEMSSEYIPSENLTNEDMYHTNENFHTYVLGTDSNTETTYHAYLTDILFPEYLQRILAVVWAIGVSLLIAGVIRTGVKLQRRLRDAEPFDADGILEERNVMVKTADGIESPFLWGFFVPVIYLPKSMDENERKYIIAHENYHRKRKDNLVKPLFFMIAAIHWFNPFVWAAYFLFVRDMEISCDEAVIAAADQDIRKEYASSILKYAARQNGYTLSPITFGEPSLKCRIQNVLHYRERNTVLSAMMLCSVVVLMTGLTAKPLQDKTKELKLRNLIQTVQMDTANESDWRLTPQPELTEVMLDFGDAAIKLKDELLMNLSSRAGRPSASAGIVPLDARVHKNGLEV